MRYISNNTYREEDVSVRCVMKKTVVKLGLSCFVAAYLALVPNPQQMDGIAFATETKKSATSVELKKVKGKITNISQKAKTIALSKKDKNFFLLKFTDDTELKDVKSSKDFKVGEAILVEFKTVAGEHIATSLKKALVKLPKGVKVVKTDALEKLLVEKDNIVLIDARPPVKYAESHIAQSISIPFSKLIKMGDKGADLLAGYKGKQLVFYCGGPT